MFEHGLFDILAIGMASRSEFLLEREYIQNNPGVCLETDLTRGPLARLLIATIFTVYEKLLYDRGKILKYQNLVSG